MLRIVSISWVRNEADIIEDFVRHHAGILDRMVIIENASTDATPLILRKLADEGFPIDIQFDPSPIHSQGPALTAAMHTLEKTLQPDWILPLDADEFLSTEMGSASAAFAHLPADAVLLLPWKTYVPTPLDDDAGPFPKRIQHRRSLENPQYHKILIPRTFHGESFRIPLGSHILEGDSTIPVELSHDLFLAHFPVRSPAQIVRKITESWERHTANPDKTPTQNTHWKALYTEMKDGILPTAERLQEIALTYAADSGETPQMVFDPIPHPLQ